MGQRLRVGERTWSKFVLDITNASLRHVVIAVALLNLSYFGIEFTVALRIGSVSLFADSIDFLEDASVNLLILLTLAWSAQRGQKWGCS
jgi:Co/Zn/Cd efflux system component